MLVSQNTMPLRFCGVAHPPAHGTRQDPADLSNAEIATGNLGQRGRHKYQTPVLVEHEGGPVGRVLASWQGPEGHLRVQGSINDPKTERAIRSGAMLGLSLGTRVHHEQGRTDCVKVRTIEELSVCEVPRREHCWIDEIDGRRVPGMSHRASKRASFPSPFSFSLSPYTQARTFRYHVIRPHALVVPFLELLDASEIPRDNVGRRRNR